MATSTDKTNNNVTKYAYDKDKLQRVEVFNSSGTSLNNETFEYDSLGRMTKNTYTFGTKTVGNNFTYLLDTTAHNADQRIGSASYLVNGVSKATATNYFDTYKRIRRKLISIGNTYDREITYDATRIARILDVKNGSTINNVSYAYDLHGRITSESDSANTNVNTTYVYDSFGQLVRENNKALDKTFVYSYNGIGNIANVKTYAYTTGAVSGTPVITSYTYDGTQVDRLTSFGGKAITYDANGCVNTYDDWTYTWTKGKLTKRVRGTRLSGIDTYTYTYDAYGRRTSKNYRFTKGTQALAAYMTSSSTNYTYDASGRLIREQYTEIFNDLSSNSREIIYLYDENGVIGVMYSYNGSTSAAYFYRRNLQGDVTAIYNREGNRVGEYAYDAWGNCTILSGASNDLVNNNPIRYRGYYFDAESGVYFLNARYYNPQWRRFISPDSTDYLDPASVNGLNLYAYCYNDPVNYADPSGNFVVSAWVVGMIVGFGVGFVSSVVSDLIFEDKINWGKAIVSGLFSSVSGALANISIPFTTLIVSNALLSAGNSIVDDVFFEDNKNAEIIIGNALISAGMSALFTFAIGDPNSKKITKLYNNAKYADSMLGNGGLHPNVKVGYNKSISIYNKELNKIVSNSLKEALCVSPIEKFSTRIYKAYYRLFFMR